MSYTTVIDKRNVCQARKEAGLRCTGCVFYDKCNPEEAKKKKEIKPKSCMMCKNYRQTGYHSSCIKYPGIKDNFIPCSDYEPKTSKKKSHHNLKGDM